MKESYVIESTVDWEDEPAILGFKDAVCGPTGDSDEEVDGREPSRVILQVKSTF